MSADITCSQSHVALVKRSLLSKFLFAWREA
jgi:hypothetical protein